MKTTLKSLAALLFAAALTVSCEEWEPVGTFNYGTPGLPAWAKYATPEQFEAATGIRPNTTIAELTALYRPGSEQAVELTGGQVIRGQVISSDRSGNIYKSLYIQDETGGIEIKTGRTSQYNDYKEGQYVYVLCNNLLLGMYGYKDGSYGGNGMVQLGLADPTGEYETSYLELQALVDDHVIRGPLGPKVAPVTLSASKLPGSNATPATCPYLGCLVHLEDLVYADEAFALLYLDSNKNKKESKNRIFLSDKTWGITTWAMSKNKMTEYLLSGIWDSCLIGNANDQKYGKVGDEQYKGDGSYPGIEKQAASVSQYFKVGNKTVQIRSSGYGKWGDYQIPADILSKRRSIDVTGILTMYQGSVQFTLLELEDVKYHDTGEPIDKQV